MKVTTRLDRAPVRRCGRCRPQPAQTAASCRRRGFTLTEILIVISIIVIVLALALPAFNFLTGSRSTESAMNQLGALLGRARAEAIGLQEVRGVMFYIDPKTRGVNAALVKAGEAPPAVTGIDIFLDLTPGRDTLNLPSGVGVEVVDDAGGGTIPLNDRYIGFNTVNTSPGAAQTVVPYGGVILFDARGQLTSKSYAMQVRRNGRYTEMGVLLYQPTINIATTAPPSAHVDVIPVEPTSTHITQNLLPRSQFGVVLFEMESFRNVGGGDSSLEDQQITNPSGTYAGSPESEKEAWLDNNALPVLINRYTGTFVKGE